MSRFSTRLVPVVVFLTFAALAHGASAQPAPPGPAPAGYVPPAAPEASVRSGWNFGGGLGGGSISCSGECPLEDVNEAGGIDLRVGNMIRPRLNVVGQVFAMFHTKDDWTLSHSIFTGGIQYWIINRLWVHGGIGFARATLRYDGPVDVEDSTENVFAIAGGIGFEIVSRRTWTIDLALRGGSGFYEDLKATNSAITADFTWY